MHELKVRAGGSTTTVECTE